MQRGKLILITGMSGSGKTTLASYAGEHGYRITTMGDVIRGLASERGLEPTPCNLALIAEGIRREGGEAAVAEKCIEKLKREGLSKVAVDGIRSLDEVEAFRNAFGDTLLLALYSSPSTRYLRLKKRGRSDDAGDMEVFHQRDRRELGFGLGSAIAMADHMIINEGSLEDLKHAFNCLMERFEVWPESK